MAVVAVAASVPIWISVAVVAIPEVKAGQSAKAIAVENTMPGKATSAYMNQARK